MDKQIASHFYNSAGVVPRTDPDCEESRFAVDPILPLLSTMIEPGMRVLDLGCNAGRFVFVAEDLGAVPTGIDCAQVPLEHARMVAKRRQSSAQFVQGDYCALPFPPASFDMAMLINNVVECSYDDFDTIVRQLATILTPGGLFCVTMPDRLTQHQQHNRSLADYDPATGIRNTFHRLTDEENAEEVPYQSYFWTVFFARHICTRYMELLEDKVIRVGSHWLVFRNK